MRILLLVLLATLVPARADTAVAAKPPGSVAGADPAPQATIRRIYSEALGLGDAFDRLSDLVARYPNRLSGSKNLEGAVAWAGQVLGSMGLDRVYTQPVKVPHWERGAPESVEIVLTAGGFAPLSAAALGGSGATPEAGLTAGVVEVHSLDELAALGRPALAGKIVFFNRPMDPTVINPGPAYGDAGDQRNKGPAAAAKFGAVAALVRSLTHAHDDVPHTGATNFSPNAAPIPAAALSTLAADRLDAALSRDPSLQVRVAIHSRWLPDADSANTIGELRGSAFPDQVILVGGHLDSWDIAPGAHDDGSGVAQSIEVLRIFRALGIHPRHTIRCVLFVNEENGLRGATTYASAARSEPGRHIFALETDNGGFQPHAFNLGSTQGDAAKRASRWLPLFEPYGIYAFREGNAGADVTPLLVQGVTVGEMTPDSQRYFDLHHTRRDAIDQVNPRELELGAAALASLIWLVDTQGI